MALVLESHVAWKQRRGRCYKKKNNNKKNQNQSRLQPTLPRALGVETQLAALRRGDEVVLVLPPACQQDFLSNAATTAGRRPSVERLILPPSTPAPHSPALNLTPRERESRGEGGGGAGEGEGGKWCE